MSVKLRPPTWVLLAALGAAFWIGFGVMAAEPPAAESPHPASDQVRDVALERMIARFASQARQAALATNAR